VAWPATNSYLIDAFQRGNSAAKTIRSRTQSLLAESAAGDINREIILDYYHQVTQCINIWTEVKNVPGITDYARIQLDDPAIDVPAEFNAMIAAAQTLKAWIETNFPTESGAVLYQTLNTTTGRLNQMVFTPAQLADFRIEAAILLATIS